jgi:Fur family transcriptional regulator, zinc uptake regulator
MTRSAVFPAPDHDHDSCASAAIMHAEGLCAARGQRLTPMRRQVLEALLASHKPLGAYDIIERLAHRGRLAPITVYRALDFLRDNGLVHRIESRNAFVACVHHHAGGDPVVFLICERCGTVGEATGGAVADALKASCRAAGFMPKSPVIEIAGICAHCRE